MNGCLVPVLHVEALRQHRGNARFVLPGIHDQLNGVAVGEKRAPLVFKCLVEVRDVTADHVGVWQLAHPHQKGTPGMGNDDLALLESWTPNGPKLHLGIHEVDPKDEADPQGGPTNRRE